ncbi:hypothetical protein [Haloferula sp. A504]|uniref:hypothetical protein n=1 Tax=Haloferula sp. A504 TaxID=3373601 RepID=UPI0031CAF2C3|nr:hypothetical protein [Verrucomicrobiaceae bacterium E54]
MKTHHSLSLLLLLLGTASDVRGQAEDYFTNFLRQVQLPSGVVWDVTIDPAGEQFSPLPIDPGGARFELWTIQNDPLQVYLLDTRYVGTYVPVANVMIRTGDSYQYTGGIPRTRADQPFIVDVEVSGLLNGEDDPVASKSVNLLRHVQSYGEGGTGENIDRTQATLFHQVSLVDNAIHRLSYTVSSIPGPDRSKVRGEERFSVFSLDDYQAPASQLASMFVQIWPVADGAISGIEEGDKLRFSTPNLTITLNDLYPDSRTYVQIYPGGPSLGTEGTVIPGSGYVVYDSVPHDKTLVIDDWGNIITASGDYTMELLTATPFGVDRLDYVTFNINRDIEVNGSVTTVE